MTDRELFEKALEASEKAYVPYSKFHVGAALLTKDGALITGCNVENASYGLCLCAERCAMGKAVSEGLRAFDAIAVASPDGEAWPCGACRQVLYELGGPELKIISGIDADHLEVYSAKELLPKAFEL